MSEVPEDRVWCAPRGHEVPVVECHTACVDECQRVVCWAGRISPSFENDPEVAPGGELVPVPVEES